MTGQDEARNLIWDIKMRGHDIDHAISTGLLATAVEDTIIALEQIAAEWERVKLSLEALEHNWSESFALLQDLQSLDDSLRQFASDGDPRDIGGSSVVSGVGR